MMMPSSSELIACLPSRHQGVLKLPRRTPLYNMRLVFLSEFLLHPETTSPPRMVTIITTRRPTSATPSAVGMTPLHVLFLDDSSTNGLEYQLVFQVTINIPSHWSPKTFLAVLHWSIQRNHVLSIETIRATATKFISINEIYQVYNAEAESLNSMLNKSASYLMVQGGSLCTGT